MITFTLQKMVKVFTILRLITCPFLSIWDTSTTRNRSGAENKKMMMLELWNKIYFLNKSKEKSSKKHKTAEKVRPEKHLVVHPYW